MPVQVRHDGLDGWSYASANSSVSAAMIAWLKRGNIVGLAAGDQLAVDHHFLVDHARPGIFQVGADRRPARHRPLVDHVRLDQQPRAVTDRRDDLVVVHEFLDDLTIASPSPVPRARVVT